MKAPGFFWKHGHPTAILLWPLSLVYGLVVFLRRMLYQVGAFRVSRLPVPVVVIGNISVGGTGKTPLVIWAARFLTENGHKPGVVLRGYGGQAKEWPQDVGADSDPVIVGDEAVLIARHTGRPVVAGPNRVVAAQRLVDVHGCNLVLSDDGLQHHALGRDVEISVRDRRRGLGNRFLLPAGPLRESPSRLREVDLEVVNGDCDSDGCLCYQVVPGDAVNLADGKSKPLVEFSSHPLHALAGIGDPDRFFDMLRMRGITFDSRSFPDHHLFVPGDLDFGDDLPVLMTEKDAVKCEQFAEPNHWYVPVVVEPERRLVEEFSRVIAGSIGDGQKTA